ncbi:MAG: M56 family metallopeptidase [Acidobacteriia bacterium]|nr:M56 family metallopeptidase [Terriglobia bacterium]
MAANHYLQFAGIILSYILKVAAGFLVCLCLSRILRRPDLRFRVWLGFLLASGLCWLALLGSAVGSLFPRVVTEAGSASLLNTSLFSASFSTSGLGRSVLNAVAAPEHWLVPIRWSQDVMIAGRTLLGAYLCVVLLLACRKTWVHVRLRRLLKLGMPPAADVTALFESMRREHGVRRCELAILPGLSSPATAYWWRPRVVLPETVLPERAISEEAAGLGANPQLASIFCHELAHIRRRDYFWANVADVICGVLFFHPAVWQARKQMRLERELASDLAVVNARPEVRADYADNLARFVRMRIIQGGISCGVDFAASASILGARIRNILAEPVRVPWWKKLSAATASAALLLSFLLLSPGLSVALDFSSDDFSSDAFSSDATTKPLAAVRQPATKSSSSMARRAHVAAAVPTAAGVHRQARPSSYEDSLRQAHTRSYVQETPAYRLTAGTSSSQVGSPNWDSPALSEPSPGNRPATRPTVSDSVTRIVLTTVGGIAIHEREERSEHGGHGHAR